MSLAQSHSAAPVKTAEPTAAFIVTGDRLCTACGYNLVGQRITREPHYGLLIVRCPECGSVAAVQEYPLLGRWANRWAAVLAVLWFILLLGMWIGSSAAIMGCCAGAAEEASSSYTRFLRDLHKAAENTAANPGRPPGASLPANLNRPDLIALLNSVTRQADFSQWWLAQDHQALFEQAGGWRGAVDWDALLIWIPTAIVALVFGWFWSVALLLFRRRWVMVWGLFIIALTLVFGLIPLLSWTTQPANGPWSAASQQIGPPVLLASMAFSTLPLAAGLIWGRCLTRALVRGLLAPSLRGSLAMLWTADGLPPPAAHPAPPRLD